MLERSRLVTLIGVVLGLSLTTTLVLRTTQAVFSATTETPTNSWSTGGVQLTNDHVSTAAFSTAANGSLTGGQVLQRCIVVTYQGSTPTGAEVRLYSSASGGLASRLDLVVDKGSGTSGATGSCSGFNISTAGIYNGTVAGLASSTSGSFANGVGSWSPTAVGQTMTYRFTITVQNVTAAQNETASSIFSWEAQI